MRSRKLRHRDAVREKRKARAFYRMRSGRGAGALPPDEAEAMRPWRGCGVALFVIAATAVVGWIAAKVFS